MARATDTMLARYVAEIEEKQQFLDSLVEAAEGEGRDLTEKEMELATRSRDRIKTVNELMQPLEEARRISGESTERIAQLARHMSAEDAKPKEVEYRSAGGYVIDYWRAGLGAKEAMEKLDLFHRAAAHQTTADNPGLLPEQILGPVINFVDESRPVVNFFGPRQLPSGSWSRPRVTQHTLVAAQAGEKTELASRKMTIDKLPVAAATYGGYVNVSRQDIDWTSPAIMDIVINDLAGYYAQVTEDAAGDALVAGGTAGPTIPTGPATAAGISTAIWTAVAAVYAATKGQGRLGLLVSPDMYGMIGPVFPPINPTNAISPGFNAASYGPGSQGPVSGLEVVLGPQLATGTMIVASTAAFEVYEDRIGSLQVVEPSVLGVQVAYAGYFAPLVVVAGGIQKITKTP
jgi:HK97 family phage major capsid protein